MGNPMGGGFEGAAEGEWDEGEAVRGWGEEACKRWDMKWRDSEEEDVYKCWVGRMWACRRCGGGY